MKKQIEISEDLNVRLRMEALEKGVTTLEYINDVLTNRKKVTIKN